MTIQVRQPDEYIKIFRDEGLIGYDAILLIARDLFLSRGAFVPPGEWEKYLSSLGETKKRLLGDFIYFYYYTVRPWENNGGPNTVRDESRIVAITSIMEKLMSTEEHLDFFAWFGRKYNGQNTIQDLRIEKELYQADFGVHRKFREYMRSYVIDSNRNDLLLGIEIFDGKDFRALNDIDEAAKVLYSMRSNFVHNAKMATFASSGSMYPLTTVIGSTAYRFLMDIGYYMYIFEKSFIKYWREQV